MALLVAASAALGSPGAARAEPRTITIGYVELADDPRYEPVLLHGRMVLKHPGRPFAGAELAVQEAERIAEATGLIVRLERRTAAAGEIAAHVEQLREAGARFVLADLPGSELASMSPALRGKETLLFNVSSPDDDLRGKSCSREIVHATPSHAMLGDALVQSLVARNWRNALVVHGPAEQDRREVAAFSQAAEKFRLRIVGRNSFVPGRDPRQREMNNPALLTSGTQDYDVVYVADASFEFARELPYRTQKPRPVVGAVGLEPVAWHWSWERNGAPQVNKRFQSVSGGRRMEGADWAAWVSVRLILEGVQSAGGEQFAQQRAAILNARVDGSKGLPVSIRPWDQQIRQSIMLATPHAAVESAPVPGFLHRTDVLDTLGPDAETSSCKLR